MIPYVEIRDRYTRDTIAIVEPQECWFELSYYDIGQFEIYCVASKETIDSLNKGRFVTITYGLSLPFSTTSRLMELE